MRVIDRSAAIVPLYADLRAAAGGVADEDGGPRRCFTAPSRVIGRVSPGGASPRPREIERSWGARVIDHLG